MEINIFDLMVVLKYLAGIGSSIVVNAFIAWLGEDWKWFQSQPTKYKPVIMSLISAGLAVLALAIVTYVPVSTLEAIAPFWAVAMVAIVGTLANKVGYTMFKKD